jgi:hypothetical protein
MNLKDAKSKTKELKTRTNYVKKGGLFEGFGDNNDNAKLFDALEAIMQHVQDLETRVATLERG